MFNSVNGVEHMKLSDTVVRSFQVIKDFVENEHQITAIDFKEDGKQMVSIDDDEKILIYDCDKGASACTVHTKKYGGDLIRFVPGQDCAIHNSTKKDDAIRYLSYGDRKEYLRYFPGHTRKVISLSISPNGNSFLSGSMDHTLRLWDFRAPNCQALLHSTGRPIVTYDPEGVIFAVGIDSETIKLYDTRSFEKGPFFTSPKIERERDCDWTGVKFSEDGNTILISTNGQVIRLFNAYDGKLMKTFTGPSNKTKLPIEASFSPDSQLIFVGGVDGLVHVWNVNTGYKICALNDNHSAPVQCVQFNPTYMMLASVSANLTFWLPKPDNLLQ